jgi:hypothetical protein
MLSNVSMLTMFDERRQIAIDAADRGLEKQRDPESSSACG